MPFRWFVAVPIAHGSGRGRVRPAGPPCAPQVGAGRRLAGGSKSRCSPRPLHAPAGGTGLPGNKLSGCDTPETHRAPNVIVAGALCRDLDGLVEPSLDCAPHQVGEIDAHTRI